MFHSTLGGSEGAGVGGSCARLAIEFCDPMWLLRALVFLCDLKGLNAEQSCFELHNHLPVTWFVSVSNSLKPTLWHSFYTMFSLNSMSVLFNEVAKSVMLRSDSCFLAWPAHLLSWRSLWVTPRKTRHWWTGQWSYHRLSVLPNAVTCRASNVVNLGLASMWVFY